NSWAEFAAQFRETRAAFLKHENAKAELKSLMPEDAKEAVGHGVRARRSKSGSFSFEIIESEPQHAAPGTRSAPLPVRWPRLNPNSRIPRNRWWPPYARRSHESRTRRSGMLHSLVALILFAGL